MSTPIILDCDPGIDDALAIAFATASPEIDLIGLTTVAGNVELAKTTANALAVASFVGAKDVPVTPGSAVAAAASGAARGTRARRLRPGRRGPAAGRAGGGRRTRDRFHHRHHRRRARGDHAGRHGPADQHRAGAAPRAAAGDLGQGLRDHGRIGVARQREPRRRVQYMGRSRGRRDRFQRGMDGADDRARRDAARPGDDRRPGAHALARLTRLAAAAPGDLAVPGLARHDGRAAGARRVRNRGDRRSFRVRVHAGAGAGGDARDIHVRDDSDRLFGIGAAERARGYRDQRRPLLDDRARRLPDAAGRARITGDQARAAWTSGGGRLSEGQLPAFATIISCAWMACSPTSTRSQ